MNYEKIANEIIKAVGGKENINNVIHCMTRLRFTLKDQSIADTEKIKTFSGVVGVATNSQQYQIIIGSQVDRVHSVIEKKLDLKKEQEQGKEDRKKKGFLGLLNQGLNVLSEVLTPLVPALAASGMLKVILLVLSQTGVLTDETSTYKILMAISDATFYFLPILVAFLAADYFKTNKVLAVVFAGVLLHPEFVSFVESGDPITFLAIPVSSIGYASSLIPALLMVWVMSYVEKIAEAISPSMIKVFFKPLVMMLIVPPVTLIVLGPIGDFIGQGIGALSTYSFEHFGWITVAILGALLPFSVLTGLNRALTPVSIQIYTTLGHEPLFRVAYIGSNMSQGAAALAVAVRTKNKELKQIAYSAATTTLLSGITEPSLFGVNIKLKKPLIATTIAGGLAGAYAGFMNVSAYAMAVPGLLSIPMFIGPETSNLIHAIITFAIAIIGTFILTLLFGFEDLPENKSFSNGDSKEREGAKSEPIIEEHLVNKELEIYSPVKGRIIPLNEVKDEAFSSGMMGKGVAVIPEDDVIYSPVDGKVGAAFPTGHAYIVVTDEGEEILIHVGINTVNLSGKYFNKKVQNGDIVRRGTPLVEINKEAIEKEGYDLTTCILLSSDKIDSLELTTKSKVTKNDVLEIITFKEA